MLGATFGWGGTPGGKAFTGCQPGLGSSDFRAKVSVVLGKRL